LGQLVAEQNRFLDIGCFDGSLLSNIGNSQAGFDLWGYEPNADNSGYQIEPGLVRVVNLESEAFSRNYDVVIYSHSIMYIPNVVTQLETVYRIVKLGGFVFVQLPDVAKNPFYLLMDDQAYTFTLSSILSILSQSGFDCRVVNAQAFPREIVIVARKLEIRRRKVVHDAALDYSIDGLLTKLETYKSRLTSVVAVRGVYVFGTTVNAAFVHEILADKVIGFVDENEHKSNKMFRGLRVCHPSDLPEGAQIFAPWGISSELIARLHSQYEHQITYVQ